MVHCVRCCMVWPVTVLLTPGTCWDLHSLGGSLSPPHFFCPTDREKSCSFIIRKKFDSTQLPHDCHCQASWYINGLNVDVKVIPEEKVLYWDDFWFHWGTKERITPCIRPKINWHLKLLHMLSGVLQAQWKNTYCVKNIQNNVPTLQARVLKSQGRKCFGLI